MGDRSYVRNDKGEVTAVDIDKGTEVHRYSTYEGTSTTKELIGVVRDGKHLECSGTDIFGNPVYTGEISEIED